MQATFRRGTEELTLLLRQEFATGEYLIVSVFPTGKEQAERFGNQDQAVAYFKFMEDRLRAQQWRYANAPEPAKAPTLPPPPPAPEEPRPTAIPWPPAR